MKTLFDLTEVIIHGAVKRVRPQNDDGLRCFHRDCLPIYGPCGEQRRHDETDRRLMMVGDLLTSFALELLVYPVGLLDVALAI